MNRLEAFCRQAKADGRKLLVPYLVAGDPDLDTTLGLMQELVRQGADIIELGFPFSDPTSDGPVIQAAAARALAAGTGLKDCLDLVSRFRSSDTQTPVVLMGYLNPVETMGHTPFADRCFEAGVDGVLIVDMPPLEAHSLKQELNRQAIDSVFLVAPTTFEARLEGIISRCSGYLYYVSLKGVTGAALGDTAAIGEKLEALRARTDLPIVIGFGIKDPAGAAAMAGIADGVVVGSALVGKIAELGGSGPRQGIEDSQIKRATAMIGRIRKAIDSIGKNP